MLLNTARYTSRRQSLTKGDCINYAMNATLLRYGYATTTKSTYKAKRKAKSQSQAPKTQASLKVAVEGCCHGELDAIYTHLAKLERDNGYKVDALLICGDFQAMRNKADLEVLACPPKHRAMRDFYKYYSGEKVAPVLTIVIGGNHEASNYLFELYHGGWLAPNMYFLGTAGCVQLNGMRIAGSSGIYKDYHYKLGHYENPPYDDKSMRSIYHTREFCVHKLSQLTSPDVFLSHDWPAQIERYGDTSALLKKKPYFKAESERGELGSPPMMDLLKRLKPRWWFSGHLHTKFEALFPHKKGVQSPETNEKEHLESEGPKDATDATVKAASESPKHGNETTEPPPPHRTKTKFLALDKCLPKRRFMEVIDIPYPRSSSPSARSNPPKLCFDPEWLAITRAFQPFFSRTREQTPLPSDSEARALVADSLAWVKENVKTDAKGRIPVSDWQTFEKVAPAQGSHLVIAGRHPPYYANPQTEALCRMLDIDNKISPDSE